MIRAEYDPCSTFFKNPTGGVAVGEEFTVRLVTSGGDEAAFVIKKEGEGERAVRYPMRKTDDGFEWSMHVDSRGLYFYYFEVSEYGKTTAFYADESLCACRAGENWQLTAYEKTDVPVLAGGGIIYQIMVDRFATDKERFRTKSGAVYRDDWGAAPYYTADDNGIVPNNDMFGGNLYGVADKLDYLKSLNVKVIYLNPIFEAASNHKYDTGNYRKADEDFGGDKALDYLIKKAKKRGIKIILDGVFSHTGADSIYFNRYGNYDSIGAYQSEKSPYYGWYSFRSFPNDYDCWWGVKLLPCVIETDPVYDEFINGEEGIVRTLLRRGIAGWRLDVADELPDAFLDRLCRAAKKVDPDAVVLGEVWEDASNKVAYSYRRRYLLGGQLDSVTNYPFKNAVLDFAKNADAPSLVNTVRSIVNNYPPAVLNNLMNMLSTHDTVRALTALSSDPVPDSKEERKNYRMKDYDRACRLLRLAAAVIYCLPGVPCVYYGDEAGMQGYEDPFNRRCYPWGEEDKNLVSYFRVLGKLRRKKELNGGSTDISSPAAGVAEIVRGNKLKLIANASSSPYKIDRTRDLITGDEYTVVPPETAILIRLK